MVKKLEDAETQAAIKAAYEEYGASIGDGMRRQQECMKEIQDILAKYDCVILPRCTLSPQGMEFMLEAVPKPPTTGAGRRLTGYDPMRQNNPPSTPLQPSTPLPGAPNAADKKGQKNKKRHEKAVRSKKG